METPVPIEKRRELIDDMTPMDDVMFTCIFRNNIPAMTTLLRVLLGEKDIKVRSVKTNDKAARPGFHSVVFDALVEGSDGRLYDVEVQKDSRGADPRRMRFYASAMDSLALGRGEDYRSLLPSCLFIITEHDYWGKGADKIVFERYSKEHGIDMNDGQRICYINGEANGETEIGKMMHDFRCTKGEEMYYNEIGKRVIELKTTEKGISEMDKKLKSVIDEYMKDSIDQTRAQSIETGKVQGIEIGKVEGIEIGKVQGIELGEKKSSSEIALRMKEKGYSAEEIASLVGPGYADVART